MARRSDIPAPSKSRTAPRSKKLLRLTDVPGVYLNDQQVHVDERGVKLSFIQIRKADRDRLIEAAGEDIGTSPAALLRAVALDPRQRLDVRLSAARQAAPYFDQRMPLKIEGSVDATGIDMAKVAAMPVTERKTLLDLLKKAGVKLT